MASSSNRDIPTQDSVENVGSQTQSIATQKVRRRTVPCWKDLTSDSTDDEKWYCNYCGKNFTCKKWGRGGRVVVI